jgi:uncharacterized membrane-anchored protein
MSTKTLAAIAAALTITTATAYAANNAGGDATVREITAMHWQSGPIEIPGPGSHSRLNPGQDFRLITGDEARRFRILGDGSAPDGLEADTANFKTGDEIVYVYSNEGFISIDDWGNVDPDALLAAIKSNTEEANKSRRQQGFPELHVTKWIEQPSLNRDTNTVSWIFEGTNGDGSKLINAVALKLGRNGVERIIWIPSLDNINASLDGFHTAVNSHEFEPGYRYTDHVASDRAAAYGVAGLVAGVLGVKLAKAIGIGGLAVFAVLAKKLGFLIVLPFVAVGSFFRRLFRRKPAVTL